MCGDSEYDPVCAFGLTWKNKCDADCGGYSCPQTAGVCFYNPNGTFIATGPAKSAAGGRFYTLLWWSKHSDVRALQRRWQGCSAITQRPNLRRREGGCS